MLYDFQPVDCLPLPPEVIEMMIGCGCSTIYDLTRSKFALLRINGSLTADNWCTLMYDIFGDATKQPQDNNAQNVSKPKKLSVWDNKHDLYNYTPKILLKLCSILKLFTKRHKKPLNGFDIILLNILDEKYVVSVSRSVKWLFDDLTYLSLIDGIVFNSKDEALRMVEIIKTAESFDKLHEKNISSANFDLYVTAFPARADDKYGLMLLRANELNDGNALLERANYMRLTTSLNTIRTKGKHWVETINSIFDYEIATYAERTVSENGEPIPLDAEPHPPKWHHLFHDARAYGIDIDQRLAALSGTDIFTDGIRLAYNFAKLASISSLSKEIERTEKKLEQLEQLPEDYYGSDEKEYYQGYLNGLSAALEIQNDHAITAKELKILIYDTTDSVSGEFEVMRDYIGSDLTTNFTNPNEKFTINAHIRVYNDWEQLITECDGCDTVALVYNGKTPTDTFEKRIELWDKYAVQLLPIQNIHDLLRKILMEYFLDNTASNVTLLGEAETDEDSEDTEIDNEEETDLDN